MKLDKLTLVLDKLRFDEFLTKLEDLVRISDVIKLKFDSNSLLIYSLQGETSILAFKCYELETDDYFTSKDELDSNFNLIITSAKKFVKNLAFFKGSDKVTLDISYKQHGSEFEVRQAVLKDKRLKIQILVGERNEIRDINKSQLSKILDKRNIKWKFKINRSDFQDIKKLASINSDESNRTLNLNIDGGVVKISDGNWEIDVDKIDSERKELIFQKSFLSCINDNEVIELSVYPNFICVADECSTLLISFEQTFSDEY